MTTAYYPDLAQAAHEMPFDQFGRYHMLREAVDACRVMLGRSQLSILDVGGFYEDNGTPTLPIQRFLPQDDVTVVDVVACELPGYIQGDGTALHFDAESFDLVVSADTLEHISQPLRPAFWNELVRVARHAVIVLAPFSTPAVEAAEKLLFEYIKAELHAEHQQLKEHRDFGLPRRDDWLAFLAEQNLPARSYPTGYLHAWLGMMLLKHMLLRLETDGEAQRELDAYYNHYFFPTERRNPAYRHLIVAEKSPGLIDAVDTALAPTIMPERENAADWSGALLPTMMAVLQRQLATRFSQERVIDEQRETIRGLEALIVEQRAQVTSQDQLIGGQREQIGHLRRETSFLERLIADQQGMMSQLQGQLQGLNQHTLAQVERYEAMIRDLLARAHWLESQTTALRHLLAAIQQGRVMRLLNRLSGRK